MNKKRTCKRCHSPLSDMDPHTICKSCRQPDPQMFYCSEDDCEACSVIKIYKPLDLLLRKQELENMAKKISPFSGYPSKAEETFTKKKVQDVMSKNYLTNISSVLEDKASGISPDMVNAILKGMCNKGESSNTGAPNKSETFSSVPSTSFGNEKENFQNLEKRLFDRIMSTLMTSLSSDSKPVPVDNSPTQSSKSPSLTAPPVKKSAGKTSSQKVIPTHVSTDSPDLSSNEDELEDNLISLFSAINPDSLAKVNKGLSENGKNDYIFKISSQASNILMNGTVLSSPSQATNLSDNINIDDPSYWPIKLTAADVLHNDVLKIPNMKLHPKVRHMHTILFGKLNPSLPQELMGGNFTLPNISIELKNEFYFARDQLQRILLMFSMVDYFSGEKCIQENPSLNTLIELLLSQLKVLLEKQANFVGLLFQEIRRDLLSDTECKEPDAVAKLIMGPAHQSQFFGPYVRELKDIIDRKGSSFCLTSKSEKANVNLFKLPIKFKEGDSPFKFLTNLRVYFESNLTSDKDKVPVFESLLPKTIIDRFMNFVKPRKLCNVSFEELALLFQKFDQINCKNFLIERHAFRQMKQSKGQSIKNYADMLETAISKCLYETSTREILRDQFIFGLQDEIIQKYLLNKFSWCFEECLAYANSKESKENGSVSSLESLRKGPVKRKQEEESQASVTKKVKVENQNESSDFYSTSSILNKNTNQRTIKTSNINQWNDYFDFEVKYSFEVYCPWTGQILRNKV